MGTLAVQSFIDRLGSALRDDTNVHWTVEDIYQYVSDGQRSAVQLRPEINPVTDTVALIAGTKQVIPALGFSLLHVVRNMGAAGSTPGRAIRWVDFDVLDNSMPDWHSETAVGEVQHYLYDYKRDRKVFYVYPQQPTSPHMVEIQYSKIPDELGPLIPAATPGIIELDDMYQPVLWYYTLFRAYSKQISIEGVDKDGRAGGYYQAFISELTGGLTSEQRLDPIYRTEESKQAALQRPMP